MEGELKQGLGCNRDIPCEECPKYVRCVLRFVEMSEYALNAHDRIKRLRVVVVKGD